MTNERRDHTHPNQSCTFASVNSPLAFPLPHLASLPHVPPHSAFVAHGVIQSIRSGYSPYSPYCPYSQLALLSLSTFPCFPPSILSGYCPHCLSPVRSLSILSVSLAFSRAYCPLAFPVLAYCVLCCFTCNSYSA